MKKGSYQFADFACPEKEKERLKLQASIMESQELLFLKNAGLRDNLKVLDLGCGFGDTLRLMQKNFSNLDLYGTDVNESFISHCKENFQDMNFFQKNVYELSDQKETFDFVYARFVFQHLTDPAKALQEIYKILKPNGVLVILDVDDNHYHLTPKLNCFDKFLSLVQKSQAERGGDRYIGHKLKDLLKETEYIHIKEDLKLIESQNIGLKNFLDLTTGLKLEQLSENLVTQGKELLDDVYKEAFTQNVTGQLSLFGVTGTRTTMRVLSVLPPTLINIRKQMINS